MSLRDRWARARGADAGWLLTTLAAAIVLAFLLATRPFLAAGAVGGGLVLVALLVRPVALLGLVLAIGAVNLAWVTGGEKELFAGLGGLDMNGIRLVGVVVGFSALVLVDRRMLNEALGPHARWYLLFLVFAGGTLAYSPSLVEGLRLLFKLAYPFLVYVAVRALVAGERELDRLGDWVLGAAAVFAVLVNPILVLAGGYTVDPSGYIRVQGLGVHQNPFAYYLLAMTFLAVARYIFRGQRRYLLLALVLSGWVVLTISRISLAAGVVGLAAMAVYLAAARRTFRPMLMVGIVILGLAVPLTPLVLDRTLGFVPTPRELATLASDPVELAGRMRMHGRETIWPVLLGTFQSRPSIGFGLGASGPVLRQSFPSEVSDIAHNEYLRLGVDTGLVGLGLLGLALGVWGWSAAGAGLRARGVGREYAAAGVAALVAGVLIAFPGNPIDYYSQFTQYIAFFCAAAVAAAPARGAAHDGDAVAMEGGGIRQ